MQDVWIQNMAVSYDAHATNPEEIVGSLMALVEYAIEAKLGYDELESIEIELT